MIRTTVKSVAPALAETRRLQEISTGVETGMIATVTDITTIVIDADTMTTAMTGLAEIMSTTEGMKPDGTGGKKAYLRKVCICMDVGCSQPRSVVDYDQVLGK